MPTAAHPGFVRLERDKGSRGGPISVACDVSASNIGERTPKR
jgi:hypothetical protein